MKSENKKSEKKSSDKKNINKKKKKGSRILFWSLMSVLLLLFLAVLTGGYLTYRFYENVVPEVKVEAGGSMPTKQDFLLDSWDSVEMETDLSGLDSTDLGVYPVELRWGPLRKESLLILQDTVAPEGEAQDLVGAVGQEFSPEEFITSAVDVTEVRSYFLLSPGFSTEGVHEVKIALEDKGGNRTVLTPKVTLYDKEKKPEILGTEDITIFAGENVSYRTGVSIADDMDPDARLIVDNSAVDPDTPGVYPVTYTAVDKYDRTSSVGIRVSVQQPPENYLDMVAVKEKTEELLAQLITDDMDEIHKAFAIYKWVRAHVPWNNTRTPRDDIEETLAGLNGEPGDCYTHAITCKTLLDAAGFETILMQRKPGPGQHYWILIKVKGEWFHMDPSPIYTNKHIAFLETDWDVDYFSQTVRYNYYAYRREDYPASGIYSPAKVKYKRGEYILEVFE